MINYLNRERKGIWIKFKIHLDLTTKTHLFLNEVIKEDFHNLTKDIYQKSL